MSKRALISVYDKTGVDSLAAFLSQSGWELVSTGGSAQYLREQHIPVTDIAAITNFPECLDGRVKTLHPAVYAGILARRDIPAHQESLQAQNILPIDLVCVNLYPFSEKMQEDLPFEEMVEFIDIGGPSMLRAAAKNFQDVIALSNPTDYAAVINFLIKGEVPLAFRKNLAGRIFALISAYDAAIAQYLLDDEYPEYWSRSFKRAQRLRYGENSHQSATLYWTSDRKGALPGMQQLHGKELSYNNIHDLDLAWKLACAFGLEADGTPPQGQEDIKNIFGADSPLLPPVCCAAVKHNTPCGVALGNTLSEAYLKTYTCDPMSIYGGVIACNVPVDAQTAEKLSELFLEIIIAPDFSSDAFAIFAKKKNIRIMKASRAPHQPHESISVDGGLLVQESDRRLFEKWELVTQAVPPAEDIADMIFGMRAVTYVKSNAIVVVKHLATVGIGGGETNRIWPTEMALNRAFRIIVTAAEEGKGDGEPARVLASDAFFPFPDVVEVAASAGITTIIQPGGSQNDHNVIETCNNLGIAMVFTGMRHFKH
ncbi:MAG: bifunctional phosphoribosylaminoimidazolecarboxamide formyltransferase/IMP cyclohydrolase [Spirochaetaceae bacterium]|nr:bifunctional phosphoribosylaminoimidazolecarboxamide formyltransferase/IMP cyclohydrolase [Spirochaetaceae bacterium]